MIPQLDRDGAFAGVQSASSPDASLRAGNAGPGLGSGVIVFPVTIIAFPATGRYGGCVKGIWRIGRSVFRSNNNGDTSCGDAGKIMSCRRATIG
jgi:hypothetical protein